MGWETRSGHPYYYHKRREGRRVVSQYCGCGKVAEAIAVLDSCDAGVWRALRVGERQEREGERAIDRQVDAAGDLARLLTDAALLAAGFHTHKGQWRKVRNAKPRSG